MKRSVVTESIEKESGVEPHGGDEPVVTKLNVLDVLLVHGGRRIQAGNGHRAQLFALNDVEIFNLESGRDPVHDQAISDVGLRLCRNVDDHDFSDLKRSVADRMTIRRVHGAVQFNDIAPRRWLLDRISCE